MLSTPATYVCTHTKCKKKRCKDNKYWGNTQRNIRMPSAKPKNLWFGGTRGSAVALLEGAPRIGETETAAGTLPLTRARLSVLLPALSRDGAERNRAGTGNNPSDDPVYCSVWAGECVGR